MAATPRLEQELKRKVDQQKKTATDPVEKLRLKCLERGAVGIKGLGRTFRVMDDDGSKSLNFEEFKKGLSDYGVTVDEADAKGIFDRFDKDGNGTLSFDEFLNGVRPPMSKSRIDITMKAFQKMDKTGDGIVTVEDLRGVYNARKHPKYESGEWTQQQVFEDYLRKFDSPNDPDGKITKEEFLNYYSGVSASIDDDVYYDLMMRNAWKL